MATLTASQLRANIYRVLDEILRSGRPIEIERNGQRIQIRPLAAPSRLGRLVRRSVVKGSPKRFVHLDWSGQWKPTLK